MRQKGRIPSVRVLAALTSRRLNCCPPGLVIFLFDLRVGAVIDWCRRPYEDAVDDTGFRTAAAFLASTLEEKTGLLLLVEANTVAE